MMKQKMIVELNKLEVKSDFYLNKYIDFCTTQSNKEHYNAKHHILPKSKNLPFIEFSSLIENEWNCAYLTYKDHYIAHYYLVNAIKHKSISFAWIAMKNKDFKTGKMDSSTLKEFSENYEQLVLETKSFYREQNKNQVTAIISDSGETVKVSKEEFHKNRSMYSTHSDNQFNVLDMTTNKHIRINSKDYNKEIHMFHTNGSAVFFNTKTKQNEFIKAKNKTKYHIHANKCVWVNRDNNIVKIRARDISASEIFATEQDIKDYKYKHRKPYKKALYTFINVYTKEKTNSYKNPNHLEYIKSTHNRKVKIFDLDTNNLIKYKNVNEIIQQNFLFISPKSKLYINVVTNQYEQLSADCDKTNYVTVTKSNIKKYIDSNFCKYIVSDLVSSSKKDKVSAYDLINQKCIKVTRNEFNSNKNLVGIKSNARYKK